MQTETPTLTPPTAETLLAQLPDLSTLSIPYSVLSLLSYDIAIQYASIPYKITESGATEVLVADPFDTTSLQAIQMGIGATIRPIAAPREQIIKLIAKYYAHANSQNQNGTDNAKTGPKRFDLSGSTSATAIVDDLLHEAIRLSASDIHFEPFEREMTVRFRIDGILHVMTHIPTDSTLPVLSRLKIMSGMDIAEKRRSQDGKIRITGQGRDVDVRASTLPTDFGEKIVLRLLDKKQYDFNLDTIGMAPERLDMFRRAISMPNGIVLLTGPTGSGKTTTLYGVLRYLQKPDINISTVEDPIEYNIPGISQTQVKAATQMTFANVLRTLLRQDPDIIMVGEMRDTETAEIATRASLTGHLVLSTLHTNDAPSAISRLIDMGIEPYLVSSSLTMVVAQRLVRRNCQHCSCEEQVSQEVRETIGLSAGVKIYKGLGCPACGYTGYKGRTGIFEVLPLSENLKQRINNKAYTSEIRQQAVAEGMITLREHALSTLSSGITSLEEVLREISVVA